MQYTVKLTQERVAIIMRAMEVAAEVCAHHEARATDDSDREKWRLKKQDYTITWNEFSRLQPDDAIILRK